MKTLFHQIKAVSILNIGQMNIGLGLGLAAILIPQLRDEDHKSQLKDEQVALIASIVSIGKIFGGLSSGVLAQLIGRKKTIFISAFIAIIGWIGMILSQSNYNLIICLRFVIGLSMGIEGAQHSIYVSELATNNYRGSLIASGIVVISSGILMIFLMGSFLHWKIVCTVCSVINFIHIIFIFFVPESPLWLHKNSQSIEAKNSLRQLGRNENEFQDNMNNQETQLVKGRQGCHKCLIDISQRKVLLPFFIVNLIFVLSNLSGFIAVIFYAVEILQNSQSFFNAYYSTIFIGFIQVLGSILAVIFMAKIKRRLLIIISSIICSLSMTLLAIFLYLKQEKNYQETYMNVLIILMLVIFTLSYTSGLGSVPWVLMGELLSVIMSSVTAGITGALSYLTMFLVGFTFPFLSKCLRLWGIFLLYALFGALSALLSALVLPETKDKCVGENNKKVSHLKQDTTKRGEVKVEKINHLQDTASKSEDFSGQTNASFELNEDIFTTHWANTPNIDIKFVDDDE